MIKIDKSFRLNLGLFQIFGGVKRVGYVNGVNSYPAGEDPKESKHILMFDFDGVKAEDILFNLVEMKFSYDTGPIWVLDTLKQYDDPDIKSLHALCFTPFPWKQAFDIVRYTPGVCETYLKMSYVRDCFTLRFSEKAGRQNELYTMIPGPVKPGDIDPRTINNFVRYLTKQA